jgi:hypothetical protein
LGLEFGLRLGLGLEVRVRVPCMSKYCRP